MLFGDSVYLFSDAELSALFNDNSVVIDGGAIMLLKERGLLSLIGAEDAEIFKAENGYQSYEEIVGNEEIFSIQNLRASCRGEAGDFVKIDYKENAEALTRVYKSDRTLGWTSFARQKNTLIIPFVINRLLQSQFAALRRHLLTSFIKDKAEIIVDSGFEGINPYLYSGDNGAHLILVNATLENFETTEFFIKGIKFEKIVSIEKDGSLKEVEFTNQNGLVTIQEPFTYMSSKTLKLI